MKPAIQAEYPVEQLLTNRWSGRAYSKQPVSDDVLKSLFEAVRWSASCYNEQPWRFIVCRKGSAAYDQLASTLKPGNSWALEAPVLILTAVSTHFQHNGLANQHAWHDLGLAIGNFSVQATVLDLNLHQLAGFDAHKAANIFQLPEQIEAVTVMALGYRGAPEQLNDMLRAKEEAPQQRKLQEAFVFENQWESPLT